MKKPTMSRRTVLRGACGATIALPFLEAMGWGQAAGPKRIVLIATQAGTSPARWRPVYDPASRDSLGRIDAKITKMSEMFAPLEPFKEKILQLRGVHPFGAYPLDDGHQPGKRALWTNLRMGSSSGPHAGPSVDQPIAAKIGSATKFRSLDLGVASSGEFFATGPGKTTRPENSPKKTFDLLFKNLNVNPNDPAVLLAKARRQSLLDTVKANYGRLLARRLGREDQLRVQSHLESIRELERSANFTVSGACGAPDMSSRPGEPTVGGPDWWTTMDAQYDIVEKAFACDLTRVVTMDLNNADNSGLLPCKFGGAGMVAGGAHGYSHSAPDGAQMATIQNAFAEHLARFLGKLDAIKEGDRSALDNTTIAWSSEVNNGGSHSIPDSPFLLVGSAGGYFKTGRFIDFMNASQRTALDGKGNANNIGLSPASGGIAHGTLLVSFLQAMGVEAQTFGNPEYSKGPAPMLT